MEGKKFIEAVREVYNNYEFYSNNSIELGKRYNSEIIKEEWNKIFSCKEINYEN